MDSSSPTPSGLMDDAPSGEVSSGERFRLLPIAVLTGLGVGFAPFAPGTAATFTAAIMVFLLSLAVSVDAVFVLAAAAVVSLIGLPFYGWAERYFRTPDPAPVVIDEYAGFLVSLSLVPVLPVDWRLIVAGALFFRVFDILKPQPIRFLEKVGGPVGILLDDLAAGAMAHGTVWITWWALGWW